MNYCDEHKLLWAAPIRTASRAVSEVLRHLGFVDPVSGLPLTEHAHTHAITVPNDKSDYAVLVNVRNPYARMASIYKWSEKHRPPMSFATWLATSHAMSPAVHYEQELDATARIGQWVHLLHVERLETDLLEVPAVRAVHDAEPSVVAAFSRAIRHNRYKDVADFTALYDDDTVRAVRTLCRSQFDRFGYDPEFPGKVLP